LFKIAKGEINLTEFTIISKAIPFFVANSFAIFLFFVAKVNELQLEYEYFLLNQVVYKYYL
jgi:hypothetical protein